ncbi:hypothetical protein F66182_2834 [Fusarium sp. NRRL 66182]|nr:hypothetical protein F66182_2834 [Fusarium sp. NRRL 66182]
MGSLVLPAVAVAALLIYYLVSSRKKSGPNLPPGPNPLPIVGNVFDLPPVGLAEYKHWIKFKDLYGPISSLNVLGTTLIVLNDRDAMHELLERKSIKSSSRPWSTFANELCGFGVMLPALPYDSTFRLHRKLVHQQLGTKAIASRYQDIQDLESLRFIIRVIEQPEALMKHIKT